jgi:uncharacterized protein
MLASDAPSVVKSVTFHGLKKGPKLLVTGAVHGNELAGTKAIEEVIKDIEDGRLKLTKGSVTFIPRTNPLAVQKGQRTGDRNLNRSMALKAIPQDYEDRVSNILCPILEAHDILLDLHSFHSPGDPFVLIGPHDNDGDLEPFHHHTEEMKLALHIGPYRIVEGWLDVYALGIKKRKEESMKNPGRYSTILTDTNYGVGTTEYIRSRGGYGVTLECGQHDDASGPIVARTAIEQTLALLKMTDSFSLTPLDPPPQEREILTLIDVIDCYHNDDKFTKLWHSFDYVKKGDLIGIRANNEHVTADEDGYIVFPNQNAVVGAEWFYFAIKREI